MSLNIDLGVDLDIVDDPLPSAAPTATDTCFLLHSMAATGSPATVQKIDSALDARTTYPNEPGLHAYTDAFFAIGGAKMYVAPLGADEVASAALFGSELGPGQMVAPSVVASADMVGLRAAAWDRNRIYVADAPDGSTAGALNTLALALIDDAGGRNTMLNGDTLIIPGYAGGATREVRASIVVAALMARSDIMTGNPNLAAAGNHTPGAGGQPDYVLGIKAERPLAEIKTLATQQVNSFRTVNNRVRNYGYWTLADLDLLPQWWDVGGSRTIMAIRAQEQAVAEELLFGQVAADGLFLDKYKGALSEYLARLQREGAIFGTANDMGYYVQVDAVNNPTAQVSTGLIKAHIKVRTSPFAASLSITLSRRAITESVA
jgi:hypothetical protein